MLTPRQKTRIIEKFQAEKGDTGSIEVQVALLSEEIKRLAEHLKKHQKDNHSRRGLLGMVARRKKLMDYLKRENARRHNSLAKKLGLKK